MSNVLKSRYWAAILYPENMVDNWREVLPDVIQVPCSYCVHDKDTLSGRFLGPSESDVRKTHIHLGLAFDGPTTANAVKNLCNRLSSVGRSCCPVCEPIISWKTFYAYLIHDTASAKASNKFLYDPAERINCNNFDIGLYLNISQNEKIQCVKFLASLISVRGFLNFADFYSWVLDHDSEEGSYFQAVLSYSGFLERLIKGNYLKSFGDCPGVK